MTNPNEYDPSEIDNIIDNARDRFCKLLANNPNLFGDNEAVRRRIVNTIDKNAPKGMLAVRETIDANSTVGIMRSIDLTILNRAATKDEVEKVAHRAADEHCATVCVYPEHVPIVAGVMKEKNITNVPPIAVVGFPSVTAPTPEITAVTVKQTRDAIAAGAKEIDMVLPTSFRVDKKDYSNHFKYIKAVVDAAHEQNIPVKVILEIAYLTDPQIAEASIISKIAGADWVKTSTGFAEESKLAAGKNMKDHKGATPHDVALMRRTVGDTTLDNNGNEKSIGVKASGGVRTREQAQAVLNAGADRIGASDGIDVRNTAERMLTTRDPEHLRASGGRVGY